VSGGVLIGLRHVPRRDPAVFYFFEAKRIQPLLHIGEVGRAVEDAEGIFLGGQFFC